MEAKTPKILYKLQKEDKIRILNKLDDVKGEPFRYLEHYEGAVIFKLRIGDYRILIDINLKRKILFIEVLDKRERIYKK